MAWSSPWSCTAVLLALAISAARRFRPDAGLLQQDLPEPGEHRARRCDAEEGRHHPDDGLHHPPLLPRLLRRGLRRFGADRVDAGEHGGEGRRRQQVPGVRRLRHGERRQGRRGGGLPRHGVLRRHTHHRHARRHRPERRSLLPGGAGQAGRAELQRQQRHRAAAASHTHHEPDGRNLQSTRAHHVAHGRSLSGAHRGAGALRQVQRPDVRQPGGPDAEPQVRVVPQERVPRRRRLVQPDGVHGPGHAGGVRQPVLPEPAGRRRPARLRPAALHRQPHPPERRRLGQQHGRLQQGLRRRHRQARPRRGQVRQPGQHTQAVRRLQLMEPSIDRSDRLVRIYPGILHRCLSAASKVHFVHKMCAACGTGIRWVFRGSVWFLHDLYMLFHLLLLDVHISWI